MTEALERIVGKLLDNMEQRLDSGATLEVKDYKAVTGALKEIKELCAAAEKKESGLVVKFVGEAGDYSV